MIDITLEGFAELSDLWGSVQGLKIFMASNQWFIIPDFPIYLGGVITNGEADDYPVTI